MIIKVLELFSGYGGAAFALSKAEIEYNTIGYSDIEKCANYIYSLNHDSDSLGDITKINIDTLEDFDLLTGGFPCQSFSIAGKREGFEAANKGKLFFEIIRIAKAKSPRWMLLENVEGIISHDDGNTLQIVLDELKHIGYHVHYTKLYSKNHGTPQNRPRIWFVCFKKLDDYYNFTFPEKEELKIAVKDLLEDEVDDKYYLSEKQLEKLYIKSNNIEFDSDSIVDFRNDTGARVPQGNLSPTLTSRKHSHTDISTSPPMIYNMAHTKANGKRYKDDGCSFTLEATSTQSQIINQKQWRRLTPKECFRLQGFVNDEIKFGNLTDSKLYFLAGNGWDISVASKIFKQMFIGNSNKQKGLGEFGL